MDLHDKDTNFQLFLSSSAIGLLLLFLGLLKLPSYLSYYPPFTPSTLCFHLPQCDYLFWKT